MITILTPTYNRGYILGKLYDSLVIQNSKEFEWIVVDDGSTDNTGDIVQKWQDKTSDFKIRYIRKENGGKHRAINHVLPMILTDYVMIVDSDDYLTSNAVESVLKWIKTIEGEERFAGVSGLRGIDEKTRIGGYPNGLMLGEYIDARNHERGKYNLRGDKAEVYRTDLLLKYKFPEFDGESFLPEGILWNTIALDGYYLRWFNTIIMITEYRADGLTKNIEDHLWNNFCGYSEETRLNMKTRGNLRWRRLGRYLIMAWKKGLKRKEIVEKIAIGNFSYYMGAVTAAMIKVKDEFTG